MPWWRKSLHTLAVRPSKRLILLYGLLYSLSLIWIIVYGKNWPWFIFFSVIISLSCAGVMSVYSLCTLKALTWLPQGKIELRFRTSLKYYDHITVCHQGPKLIILQCKSTQTQRYLLCLADAFNADDFGLLQRLLKTKEWLNR